MNESPKRRPLATGASLGFVRPSAALVWGEEKVLTAKE